MIAVFQRKKRRGMTLVEIVVMLAAVAGMLGVCILLLALLMRLETDGRAAFERSATLNRLARRFRNDVHGARNVSLEGTVLKIADPTGERIEYRVVPDEGVSRINLADDEQQKTREVYRIPQSAGVTPAIRQEYGRTFAVLTVDVQISPDRIDPVHPIQIPALVGKNVPSSTNSSEGDQP